MAKKVSCDNCDADVIVNGQQILAYYEYDALPFPVATASPDRRAIICVLCDKKLRRQHALPPRGASGRA